MLSIEPIIKYKVIRILNKYFYKVIKQSVSILKLISSKLEENVSCLAGLLKDYNDLALKSITVVSEDIEKVILGINSIVNSTKKIQNFLNVMTKFS